MIGFPLTLPIEATTERNIYLVNSSAVIRPSGWVGDLLHDQFYQLRIQVTAAEYTALQSWLSVRGKPTERADLGSIEDPGL